MAIVTAILQKIGLLFSTSIPENGLSGWFATPFSPSLHVLVVALAIILMIFIYSQAKKNELQGDVASDPDPHKTTTDHLMWTNQLIGWLFVTSSSPRIPVSVEKWIEDLNIHLNKQKNNFGTLIYGLREGTVPPWIKEIGRLQRIKNDIHTEVLLETSEFGFTTTIQENEGNKIISSNYSAIVVQFQCRCSAILTRNNENILLKLSPSERKPIFRFKMKPITKQTVISTVPESIADALRYAILSTPFYAELSISGVTQQNLMDDEILEEEESCYGDSEDEDSYKDVEGGPATPRVVRSLSDGQVLDCPPVVKRHIKCDNDVISSSAPGSRSMTPISNGNVLQEISKSTRLLSGSLGSLSSIRRTPSGRGPAKPIRFREKRLLVKVVRMDGIKPSENHQFYLCLELDSPNQFKDAPVARDLRQSHMTFDLSSRSSQLKLSVRSKSKADMSTNGDEFVAHALVPIDSINMETQTNVEVPLKDNNDDHIGLIDLELMIIENCDNISQSESLKHNNADKTPQRSGRAASDDIQASIGDKNETRVTMVTTRVKGSPARSNTDTDDVESIPGEDNGEVTGVSYNSGSVAETALKDLSSHQSEKPNVTKTKILITVIEQNKDDSLDTMNDTTRTSSNSDSSPAHDVFSSEEQETQDKEIVENIPINSDVIADSVSLSHDVELRSKAKHLKEGSRVRRTRSLVFGGGKKYKQHRNSLVVDEKSGLPSSETLQIPHNELRNTKKSSSMTKLFSRMSRGKKNKGKSEASNNVVLEEGSDNLQINGDGNDTDSSNKIKRNRSFKNMIRGKKKSKS